LVIQSIETLAEGISREWDKSVVWLLCHYPEHPEAIERVKKAAEIYRRYELPIWLFGSFNKRYQEPVEQIMKGQLVAEGVPPGKVSCSTDLGASQSMDTVQEMFNVVRCAKDRDLRHVICVSNPLQLLQVHGLLRREEIHLVYVPITLRDWRWWYLSARLALIPVAYLGFGPGFLPLKLVRHARARWAHWPF
jgi:uncharacterized SAM-binding protein YcdF (DUF218 family)